MKLWVVVTAAGSSRRMGGQNKLLMPLAGRPLLVHTLEYFQNSPEVHGLAVSAGADQLEVYRELVEEYRLTKVVHLVPGGAERQDSIRNALLALPGDTDAVAIHDGARPFMRAGLMDELLSALQHCDGSLPMVAVKDTIKRVDPSGQVVETLVRSELYAAQTPQVFRYSRIREAHLKAHAEGFLGTDDCSLIEAYGGRIQSVPGDYQNIKVTTPEDLPMLEKLWEERVV